MSIRFSTKNTKQRLGGDEHMVSPETPAIFVGQYHINKAASTHYIVIIDLLKYIKHSRKHALLANQCSGWGARHKFGVWVSGHKTPNRTLGITIVVHYGRKITKRTVLHYVCQLLKVRYRSAPQALQLFIHQRFVKTFFQQQGPS